MFKARNLLSPTYGDRRVDNYLNKFGDDDDFTQGFDGTNLEVLPKTDDTGAFNVGDGTTDCDFKVFLGSTSAYALFDVGNALLQLEAVDLLLGDNDEIRFGDGVGGDITLKWDAAQLEFLPRADDTGAINIGDGTTDCDFKVFLGTTADYFLCDVGSKYVETVLNRSSQTTENIGVNLSITTDSTYLTGSNLTYSGARGSSGLKINSTYTGATGGFSNIYSNIAMSGAIGTDGNGVIGIKQVVTNTAGLTDGEVYGGQFIAKHNHATNIMTAQASLIGLEAWAYVSAAGVARTCIGGNFGWHNEATGGTYGAGSVIRGIQIFCDNNAGGNDPVESTGLCIWNQAGTIVNAINVVNSGSGFTYFLQATDDGVPATSTGTTTTEAGRIKVRIGTATRYIPLYTTPA